ncbi:uncharacterized protein LOC135492441 [Lineus longissimus]|uniref:uncharacterized protein LOC135492441 n=1 Tax=Lineus longissimus TaxID=88925 RepID=UPI00315D983C
MMKLFLILGLAALGALAQDVKEVGFTLEGKDYRETVVDGVDTKFVVVPKQGAADHTIIMHDFEARLTVFKDFTSDRCIIMPLNREVTMARGIIFKDHTTTDENVPSENSIMLDVDEESIEDIEAEAGEKIAKFCRELPSFRAGVFEGESTPSPSLAPKRVRRGWLKKTWKKVKKHVKPVARVIVTRAIVGAVLGR